MPSPMAISRMILTFDDLGFDWLLTVPAAGVQPLYAHFEASERCIFATREEEAIALAAGLRLGGGNPIVVMQQSGVGNALNAVFSLAEAYEISFPVIVCDRTVHDPNPVQRVSSAATARVLRALGANQVDWEQPDAPEAFRAALDSGARWLVAPMVGSS